jgi:LacI family transcriptional regulator
MTSDQHGKYVSVTIKDVARQAGVSIATVSHVINGTRYVSEETTARVNAAIEDLGYYPNKLVGSLRSKKTYTIGLVLPSISNETFGLLAEVIQKNLFKFGYNLIICNTTYNQKIEEEAFNTLLMKKVDAILAIPSSGAGDKLREIKGMGIPVVLVDRLLPGLQTDSVRVDNVQGLKAATRYLLELGHRSIGYIDRKIDQSHSIEQKTGFRLALAEAGLSPESRSVVRAGGYDYKSGVAAAQRLIEKNPALTAIIAYYDITALGALRGLADLGYRIPQDISLIGYDGMPVTEVACPRLTTVSFPVHQIARAACNLLMKRLEQAGEPQDIVIVPELIVRDSTAAPRS